MEENYKGVVYDARKASCVIFKSQGGLDFDLNYKHLTPEQHRGLKSPHRDREIDLKYKRELQRKLEDLLVNEFYTIDELVEILGLKRQQANKAFRKYITMDGIHRGDVIFRLMGERLYLYECRNCINYETGVCKVIETETTEKHNCKEWDWKYWA